MKMLKDEIKDAVQTWPANARAPLTREQQIALMTTARERHRARIERFKRLLKET